MLIDSANVAASPPARMIVRSRDAMATPRMTPRTFTRPSWLPRMKSERIPGCRCCSSLRASSSSLRQNRSRVAIVEPRAAKGLDGFDRCVDIPGGGGRTVVPAVSSSLLSLFNDDKTTRDRRDSRPGSSPAAKALSRPRPSDRAMVSPDVAARLADLSAAIAASRADPASEAALAALQAGTPPSAAGLLPVLPPKARPFPVLQAVALAASEPKSARPAKPPLVVSGEITHLGRSFVFAARDGDLPEAESVFLGILDEGWERRMAGELLFRAAIEDMGDAGGKLVTSVGLWRLARALGFKDARVVLRPAVEYLVTGPRDSRAHASILQVLGKSWVDLEALASSGRPLPKDGPARVAEALASPDDATCASAVLKLLTDGASAASLAEALSLEAARRAVASKGDPAAAGPIAFAWAARFVLDFTRTADRLHALFQSALLLRGPSPDLALPSPPHASGQDALLRSLEEDLDARRPDPAAACVSAYLASGGAPARLAELLASRACRSSAAADGGRALLQADVSIAEFLGLKSAEPAMALAAIQIGRAHV